MVVAKTIAWDFGRIILFYDKLVVLPAQQSDCGDNQISQIGCFVRNMWLNK